jgi:hypothetical protein
MEHFCRRMHGRTLAEDDTSIAAAGKCIFAETWTVEEDPSAALLGDVPARPQMASLVMRLGYVTKGGALTAIHHDLGAMD